MQKLSVVISVYNGEKYLTRLLDSVKWADEIIIVNNSSTDETIKIARKYTNKIFTRENLQMLNLNKNFGFEKASSDWILNLDADEEITPELKDEIVRSINSQNEVNGYWVPRKNIIFGKWIKHGLWWPDKQLRLFKNGKGKFPGIHIHEYIKVQGQLSELKNTFNHYNYEYISQFLYKLDSIYTENEVKNLQSANYQVVWQDAIKFPVSDFIKIYFAQKGYQDGLHGLVLAILQSFYSFIVFAKLWERNGFPQKEMELKSVIKEFDNSAKEMSYWKTSSQINQTTNPIQKLFFKIKRKFFL